MRTLIAASLLVFAVACSPAEEAKTDAATTTQGEPRTAEEATARDTCGAQAHLALVGQEADAVDLSTLPEGSRIIHSDTALTRDFVPTRINVVAGVDGRVAMLACY